MIFAVDARVPVVFGTAAEAVSDDALLVENGSPDEPGSFQPGMGHAPGCACCLPRNGAGRALAALLQSRARGQVGFFRRVIAVTSTPAGRQDVEAALLSDPVAAACFRQVPARP